MIMTAAIQLQQNSFCNNVYYSVQYSTVIQRKLTYSNFLQNGKTATTLVNKTVSIKIKMRFKVEYFGQSSFIVNIKLVTVIKVTYVLI